MRHNLITLTGGALTLLLAGSSLSARADQTFAQDSAADPAYNGGTFDGINGGFGFGPWSVNAPSGGNFIGDSTNNGTQPSTPSINTGGKAFGIYSINSETTATRPLTAPLAVGQTLSLDFDNGYINNGSSVGFYFSNATSTPLTVFFSGGDNQYRLNTPGGTTGSNLGYTDGGLHAAFSLTSATTYSFSMTRLTDNSSFTQTGAISGGVSSVSFFNNVAGSGSHYDVYANSLKVTTPAPSSLMPMAGGLTVLFGSLLRRKRN